MRRRQHRRHILAPSFLRPRLIALGQKLQLQAASLVQEFSRCWYFSGHLQTQQSTLCLTLGRLCHRLRPAGTGCGIDALAQVLGSGQCIRLAVFPGR